MHSQRSHSPEQAEPKTATVIGATGHLGNAITRALLASGYTVTACGRRLDPPANLRGLPVRYVPGDADRPGEFQRRVEGQDLVVDAAAPYPLDAVTAVNAAQSSQVAHAELRTRRLIDAVTRSRATLIYIGSFVTLVRPRNAQEHAQDAVLRLLLPYFEVKKLIESMILEAVRRGLRVVLVNPTYCLGPWDLRDLRISTIPLLLHGEIPATIGQKLNVIDVRDVASATLEALAQQRFGEPLLLGGHDISTNDLYSMICELGGVSAPRLVAPTLLTMGIAYMAEAVYQLMGRQTPLPTGGMMMAAAFDYMPHTSMLAQLGIIPRPLRDTIADAIAWYRGIHQV
jgi:dihydroflavonol-4-reductase